MKREIIFTLAIASSLLAPALLKSHQAVRTEAAADYFSGDGPCRCRHGKRRISYPVAADFHT